MKWSVFFLIIIGFIWGCKKSTTGPLSPTNSCDTTHVTYKKDVLPVLVKYCYACHSGPAAINGHDFADTSFLVLLSNDPAHYIPNVIVKRTMPPVTSNMGYPDSCSINKMWAWVNAGSPFN